jgi:hypothetical protein
MAQQTMFMTGPAGFIGVHTTISYSLWTGNVRKCMNNVTDVFCDVEMH